MILKVNPTRINLLNLKKELKVAVRGHKLLKDKRDGLMKKFMETIKEAARVRAFVENNLRNTFLSYSKAEARMGKKAVNTAFMMPAAMISIDVSSNTVMSVPVPKFSVKKEGRLHSYGFLDTSGELDESVNSLDASFENIVRLAELEKAVENLAIEIERTRRRASALENTRIPNLKDTIRFITMRLEEQARDAIVGTMRIKAEIEKKG